MGLDEDRFLLTSPQAILKAFTILSEKNSMKKGGIGRSQSSHTTSPGISKSSHKRLVSVLGGLPRLPHSLGCSPLAYSKVSPKRGCPFKWDVCSLVGTFASQLDKEQCQTSPILSV